MSRSTGRPRPSAAPSIGAVISGLGVAALLGGLGVDRREARRTRCVGVFIGVSVLGPVLARPVAFVLGLSDGEAAGHGGLARSAERHAQSEAHGSHRGVADDRCRPGGVHHDLRRFDEDVDGRLAAEGLPRHAHRRLGRIRRQHGPQPGARGRGAHDARRSADVRGAVDPAPRSTVLRRRSFQAFDTTTIGKLFDLGNVEGDVSQLGADGIAVKADSESVARPQLGDTRQVTFVTGTKTFVVRAIYDNSARMGRRSVRRSRGLRRQRADATRRPHLCRNRQRSGARERRCSVPDRRRDGQGRVHR